MSDGIKAMVNNRVIHDDGVSSDCVGDGCGILCIPSRKEKIVEGIQVDIFTKWSSTVERIRLLIATGQKYTNTKDTQISHFDLYYFRSCNNSGY
ncbi:MAG: hypothetical protein IPI90_05170 [Saprospiraceae bacterium]|nr:hypothetical protein [Candidatus Vicinibacter affinis]